LARSHRERKRYLRRYPERFLNGRGAA